MKFHRTSIRKNTTKAGGYIVTNYAGHKFHVGTKERANEIADASKKVVKNRRTKSRR